MQASCEVECNGAIAAARSGTRNPRYAKKAYLTHIGYFICIREYTNLAIIFGKHYHIAKDKRDG